ncbi:hypothetical protein [Verrucosispora sp. NA02020]|uniref:hypothetical protein n=1 Tax=unclassified Micromonospora TaxID=2617518 RepID=UPI0015924A44|nr:hypothetical protein [Verrucosispora sp. NA02020]QKW12202.1 hypothetical protein HUT12_04920 [Verrucosispora sp. NA02020]
MKQHTADGAMLGTGNWSLVPPGSDDFEVYGGAATVQRAREWAFKYQLLLYRGPAQACVHGLYRMDVCTFSACTSVGMDHTQIWVQHDGRTAFLLTHPYAEDIPDKLRVYAEMHGLSIRSNPFDGWYGHGTLPIRLTIPPDWPLWPIERDSVLLLHTQPVEWPESYE